MVRDPVRSRRVAGVVFISGVVALGGLVSTASAAGTFTDDDGSVHEQAIEALAQEGIVVGCTATTFCPGDSIKRGQFAAILDRSFDLPVATADHFDDDDGSVFEAAINRVAEADITSGCSGTDLRAFCPHNTLSRGQMAALLDNAFGLPDTAEDFFDDDEGTVFEAAINRVAAAGITSGCAGHGDRAYCPKDPVLRGQLATLMANALGLLDVNEAPTALDGSAEVVAQESVQITLVGEDPDGDVLTFAIVDAPSSGTVSAPDADGLVTYTHTGGFVTEDAFTFAVSDGEFTSAPATVSIAVMAASSPPAPANQPPAFDSADTATPDENQTAVGTVTATDPEASPVTFTLSGSGADDALFAITPDGVLSFLSAPNFEDPTDDGLDGIYDVEVVASDGSATSTQLLSVTVQDVNDAPVGVNDAAGITEEAPNDDTADNNTVTGNVITASDTDEDAGASLSVTNVQGAGDGAALATPDTATGDHGTLAMGTDGAWTYTLDDDDSTVDTLISGTLSDDFTYTVSDGLLTDTAILTVTITGANDPPLADDETFTAACNIEHVVESSALQTAEASGSVARTITDNLLTGDSDPAESTAISIVSVDGTSSDTSAPFSIITDLGGTATVNADGSFVYTPQAGDRGVSDMFTYTIEDADGGQDTAVVTLEIGSVCAWFVDNTTGADDTGTGTSSDPFTSLVDEVGPDALADDAEDASGAGDVIYVFEGASNTGDPYAGPFDAQAGQRLLGEGVDLVMDFGDGDETLVTGAAGTKARVDFSGASPTISVGDLQDVEIAGLDVRSASNTGIAGLGGTDGIGLDLHDNAVSGSLAVVLTSGSGAGVARVADNTLSSVGGVGVYAESAGGTLALAIDRNTVTASTTGFLLNHNGGGGAQYLTSLCGNVIEAATTFGIKLDTITVDANPSDADFTSDTVHCASTTTIGTSGTPIAGDGLVIVDSIGDLSFATLDIFTNGANQVALDVTAPAALNAAAGTGFRISTAAGTISSADGAAVVIDPAEINLTFDAVTSTSSNGSGISLTGVGGTFDAKAGTLSGASLAAILVDNAAGSELDVTYSGTITHAGSLGVLDVTDHEAGIITLDGASVGATAGTGLQFSDADGIYDISAPVVLGGGDAGLDILAGSAGTFTFDDLSITDPSGTAVNLDESSPDVTWTAGTVSKDSAGRLVSVRNQNGGTLDLGASFSQVVTAGTGVSLTGFAGTVIFSGAVDIGTTTTRLTSNAVAVVRSGGTVTFADLDMATNGAGGLLKVLGGNLTITTGTVDVTNLTTGAGVDVSGGTSNVTLTDVNVAGIGGSGVLLTNMSGTTNLSGVTIATNTGTYGLYASAAGTLNVTGSGNTISSITSGTAPLWISNTDLGASDATFESISANGTSTGIAVNNTGSVGALIVTGNAGAGSGGTIQSTAGNAITLSGTDYPSLSKMIIGDSSATAGQAPDNTNNIVGVGISLTNVDNAYLSDVKIARTGSHGIDGTGVGALGMLRVTVLNAGDTNDEHGLAFDGTGLNNLDGTMTWSDVVVDGSWDQSAFIQNGSGTLDLTISGTGAGTSRFANTTGSVDGADGLRVEAEGTANSTVTVDNVTFEDLEGNGVTALTSDSSQADVIVRDSTFVGCAAGACSATGSDYGIALVAGESTVTGQSSDMDITVTGNTMSANWTTLLVRGWGASNISGTIQNNLVGTSGVANSGSTIGRGIEVRIEDDSESVLRINNNQVHGTQNYGLWAIANGDNIGPSGTPRMDVTATGNTIGTPNDAFLDAVSIVSHSNAAVCAAFTGNTVAAGTGGLDSVWFSLESVGSQPAAFLVDGLAGSGEFAVENHLTANNTLVTAAATQQAALVFGPGTCTTP